MSEEVQGSKSKAQSLRLLACSFFCGGGVDGWWGNLCTNSGFYTHSFVQQLPAWVQNGICAQFLRFYSSVLSTLFSDISSLFLTIYTPFPQALLLKKLSK